MCKILSYVLSSHGHRWSDACAGCWSLSHPGCRPPAGRKARSEAGPKQPSTYDKIWANFTNWYDDKENPVVQRVLFTGRFQHDFAIVDADQGDTEESNIRRVRFGPRITLFRDLPGAHRGRSESAGARSVLPAHHRRLRGLAEASEGRRHGRQAERALHAGRRDLVQGAVTIDRSNLANNIWFGQEYMPGVSVSGRAAPWNYRGGVYSSGAMNREFGRVQRRRLHARPCSATTSQRSSASGKRC